MKRRDRKAAKEQSEREGALFDPGEHEGDDDDDDDTHSEDDGDDDE